jgi:hypothetical protein
MRPPDKFVENLDVLLYVIHLGRILCVENGERGDGGTIINVAAPGLDETTDEENLEECVCILEEF